MTGKPPNHQSMRELLRWLLLAPIVFLILFGCGQVALGDFAYPADLDTRSKLQADYDAWPLMIIPAINPAIIEDIRRDENLNPTVVSGPFWPTPDRPAATLQPTLIVQRPTATPTRPEPTSTPGNTPTITPPSPRTSTPYPTRTRWLTATPTVWPTATETPWPTVTSRPPQSTPHFYTNSYHAAGDNPNSHTQRDTRHALNAVDHGTRPLTPSRRLLCRRLRPHHRPRQRRRPSQRTRLPRPQQRRQRPRPPTRRRPAAASIQPASRMPDFPMAQQSILPVAEN